MLNISDEPEPEVSPCRMSSKPVARQESVHVNDKSRDIIAFSDLLALAGGWTALSGDLYEQEPGDSPIMLGLEESSLQTACPKHLERTRSCSFFQRNYADPNESFCRQCFCGNSINPISSKANESSCTYVCPGNSSAICGGTYL